MSTDKKLEHRRHIKIKTDPGLLTQITIPTIASINNNDNLLVHTNINGITYTALIDTGASHSLIDHNIIASPTKHSNITLKSISGHTLINKGTTKVRLKLNRKELKWSFIVTELDTDFKLILGRDFLSGTQAILNFRTNSLTVFDEAINFIQTQKSNTIYHVSQTHKQPPTTLRHKNKLLIPSRTHIVTTFKIKNNTPDTQVLLIGHDTLPKGVFMSAAITDIRDNTTTINLVNTTTQDITLQRNTPVAYIHPLQDYHVFDENNTATINAIQTDVSPQNSEEIAHLTQQLSDKLAHLPQHQIQQVLHALRPYYNTFTHDHNYKTLFTSVKHHIQTQQHAPISAKPYRVAHSELPILKALVQDSLERGIIEPSISNWAHPVILVKKKTHSYAPIEPHNITQLRKQYRFVVDMRRLNAITKTEVYPLPDINTILSSLHDSQYLSALDISNAFHSIQLDEQSQDKTTFITQFGTYKFKALPFGLKNAPGTFQRCLDVLLTGYTGTLCHTFIDDILIFHGNTFTQHLESLIKVITRLHNANLSIQLDKCSLFKNEVVYLGYKISKFGISPDPSKLEAVKKYPVPKKTKDVRAFLGFSGFYRRFVHNYSDISKPLTTLTQKNQKFKWSEECQRSFETIKQKLLSPPCLAFPDYTQQFILTTDASKIGISAILSQEHNGYERPIGFSSRLLTTTEQKLCTTEREILAVLFGCAQFRHIIYGFKIKLVTDHSALQWIKTLKDPHSKLYRWSLKLDEYNFEIVHRKGTQIPNADALSRYIGAITSAEIEYLPSHDIDDIIHFQKKDTECKTLSHTPQYHKTQTGLIIHTQKGKILLPKQLRTNIIQLHHNNPLSAHYGREKTLARVQEQFYWPNITTDINNYINTCNSCALRKNSGQIKPPVGTFHEPKATFEALSVDIVGPLEISENGQTGEKYKYILTVICQFSRFLEAFPIVNQTAETVAKVLVNEIFTRYGTPKILLSDLGTNFTSTLLKEICKILKIKKIFTTAYNPKANGKLERTHRDLANSISHYVNTHTNTWHTYLPLIKCAHNTHKHTSTGYTPYELVFGFKMHFPWTLRSDTQITNYTIHSRALKDKIHEVHKHAKQNTSKAQTTRNKYANRHVTNTADSFTPGQYIYIKNFTPTSKFSYKWQGPHKLVKMHTNNTVTVRINNKMKKLNISHIKHAPISTSQTHKMTRRSHTK